VCSDSGSQKPRERALGEDKQRRAKSSREIGDGDAINALADVVIEAVRVAIAIHRAVRAVEVAGDGGRGVMKESVHGRMR
jgi:hypothetical protein